MPFDGRFTEKDTQAIRTVRFNGLVLVFNVSITLDRERNNVHETVSILRGVQMQKTDDDIESKWLFPTFIYLNSLGFLCFFWTNLCFFLP